MALNAGSAYVSVKPDLRGFHTALKKDLQKMEQSFADSVGKGIRKGQREGFSVATLTPHMTRIEKGVGKAVSKGVRDGMRDGFSRSAQMHTQRFEKNFSRSMGKAVSDAFKSADYGDLGKTIEKAVNKGLKGGVTVTVRVNQAQAQQQGKQAAQQFASAFDKTFRTRLAAASRALPDVQLDADSSKFDHKLAEIQAALLKLNQKKIGVDIDAARALVELRRLESQLSRLGRSHPNVQVRADTLAAAAQLRAIKSAADDAGSAMGRFRKALASGEHMGHWLNRTSLTFGQMIALATTFGTVAIPVFSAAAVGAAGLASSLFAAGGAFTAFAVVATIGLTRVLEGQEELKQLRDQQVSTANQVANAEQALADALRGVARARADAARQIKDAQRGVADAADAVGEAERDAAASVEDAQRAIRDAHKDSAESIRDAEQAVQDALRGVQGAMRAVDDAQRNLAEARREAADAATQANDDVRRSEEELVGSQQNVLDALEALHAAREQAKADLDELAEKTRDNALTEEGAALALQRARDTLAQAEQSGTATQLDLAEARHAVAEAEDTLSDQRKQSAADLQKLANAERLGIEGSEGVRSAREQLAEAEREVAEAQQATAKARADAANARAAAARRVGDAERALADARRGVADAERGVADAQRRLAEARRDGAAAIADAKRRLADARADGAEAVADANEAAADAQRALADARRQGAQSVADAQRQVGQARRQLSSAEAQLAQQQRDRAKALREMGTGAGIALAGVNRLKRAFQQFMNTVQPVVFRNLVKGMDALRPLMKAVTPLVRVGAKMFGAFADRFAKFAGGPWLGKFIGWMTRMSRAVGPPLMRIFFGLIRAIGNIVRAFGPVGKDVTKGLARMIGQFARWTAGLRKNKEFQQFIAYAREMAPHVLGFFGALIVAGKRIIQALSPIGDFLLKAFEKLFLAIDKLPIPVLTALIGGLTGAIVAWRIAVSIASGVVMVARGAMLLWAGATKIMAGAQKLLNFAMSASPLALAVKSLLLLGAALVWAYHKFEPFRRIVDMIFKPIVDGAKWVWDYLFGHSVFPDLLHGFKVVFAAIGKVVRWLWDNVIKTVFKLVGWYVGLIWKVIKGYITAWVWVFEHVLFPVIEWLWDHIVKPVFKAVWQGIKFAWGLIKGYFNAWVWVLKKVVFPVIEWLWDKVVKPVFGWIGDKIATVWEHVIKPVFEKLGGFIKDKIVPAFKKGVEAIGKAWDWLKNAAVKPVNFVIDTVYNNGIRKFVNGLLDKFGSDMKLPYVLPIGWNDRTKGASTGQTTRGIQAARGGVLPGYTPGRDVHHFTSPTGGKLHLSGGEAIMRPEWTRAVGGPKAVARMNKAAVRAGLPHEQEELGYAAGGVWDMSRRVYWDGEPLSAIHAAQLKLAQKLSRSRIHVMQGSWQPATSYSGTSHTGSGVADTSPGTFNQQAWQRKVGIAAWARNIPGAASAGSGAHIHGVSRLDPAARGHAQLSSFARGENGLGTGPDYGPNPPTLPNLFNLLADFKNLSLSQGSSGGFMSRLVQKAVGWLAERAKGLIDRVPGSGTAFGQVATGAARRVIDNMSDWIVEKFSGGAQGEAIGKAVGEAQKYAQSKLKAHGWGPEQFTPLKKLWERESNWRWNAENPSSGAYGIPQALPPGKMASAGRDWRTNPATQIRWGLGYIKGRYGSPTNAWAHSENVGWYDRGGWLKNGGVALNRSGKPEPVFTNKQWQTLKKAINALTLGKGDKVTPSFLMDYMPKLPKTVQRLYHEFEHARDALRRFRENTERARDALRAIRGTRRYRRANRRVERAQAALGDTLKLTDIRTDMRQARSDRERALRRAGRTPMGRDALADWRKANRALGDRRSLDELANAEKRLKWRRGEADSKAERERINKRLEALAKERKETEKLLRQRKNAAGQSKAVQELENATARIELLQSERKERKRAMRELKQARNVPVIQRAEKAEARLNKRLREQEKAMDRAKQAAARYRAAQEAAIARAKDIFGKGMELGTIENAPWKTSGGILYNLRRSFMAVTQWTDVVKQLKRAGLRGPIMDEFINAGPSAEAVRTGRSLLASGQIAEINRMQTELRNASLRAGTIAAAPLNKPKAPQVMQAKPVRLDQTRNAGLAGRAAHVHYHGMPADTVNTIVNKTVARLNHQMARQGV